MLELNKIAEFFFQVALVSVILSTLSMIYYFYKKRGRSTGGLWLYCEMCLVKWRPTAYGPPWPDDKFCPKCGNWCFTKQAWGRNIKHIPRYKEKNK